MLTGELPLGKFCPRHPPAPRGLQVDVRLDESGAAGAGKKAPNLRYQHASQVKTAVENIASTQFGLGGWRASSRTGPRRHCWHRIIRWAIRKKFCAGVGALVKRDFFLAAGGP